MQKLNVETEVYNSNKNVTEGKKIKNFIRFHSANEIGNYNMGRGKEQNKQTNKIIKNLQSKAKHENNAGFSLITGLFNHQSPFPRWKSQSASSP